MKFILMLAMASVSVVCSTTALAQWTPTNGPLAEPYIASQ